MAGAINLVDNKKTYVLTKSQILVTVAQESPRAAELLADYGLHCISCFFSEYDTLETGAKVHGMGDADVEDMVSEINAQLEREWKEAQSSKIKDQSQTQNLKL